MLRPALSINEAADVLAVNPRTIEREIRRGRLSAFRVGRAVRILPDALQTYTTRSEAPSATN
jgi:excisionase family DNA binding protein